MAAILISVKEDIQEIDRLRKKMEELKKSMISLPRDAQKEMRALEKELKSVKNSYNELIEVSLKALNMALAKNEAIKKSTQEIIRLQDETVKSGKSGMSSSGSGIQNDTKKLTTAVREQADAYKYLKRDFDDYMGSVERKIIALNKAKEQIKKWQSEIKKLESLPDNSRNRSYITEFTKDVERSKLEVRRLKREIAASIQFESSVPDSMKAISQSLGMMREFYRGLSAEERGSVFGMELSASIEQADAKIKELDASIGNHQRNVGNYALGLKTVRAEQRGLVEEIAGLTIAYRNMTEAEKQSASGSELRDKINELTEKAAMLKDAMADTNRAIASRANDTMSFVAISDGIQMIISGFGVATGAAQLLGITEEDLVEVQTKLQATLVASNSVRSIQNTLQKESALMQGVSIIQTKAATAAENVKTAAIGRGLIATKAATIAQGALNLVANANPYVLLATAIVSVVGALWAFKEGASEAEKQSRIIKDTSAQISAEYYRETTNLDNLRIAIENAEKGSKQWFQIKNAIVSQYGQFMEGLDSEIIKVGDLSSTYDRLSDAVRRSIAARQLSKFRKEYVEPAEDRATEILMDVSNSLNMPLKSKDGRHVLPDEFKEILQKNLANAIFRNDEKALEAELKKIGNIGNLSIDFKKRLIGKIRQGFKGVANSNVAVSRVAEALGFDIDELKNPVDSSEYQVHTDELELASRIKELEQRLHSLSEKDRNGKPGAAIKAEKRQLEARYRKMNDFGESVNSNPANSNPANNREQILSRIAELRAKNQKEISRWLKDAGFESRQAEIDTDLKGAEKKLKQMDLDHDKELDAIKREKEDLIAAHVEKAREIHEAQERANAEGNASYKKKAFNPNDVALSDKELDVFKEKAERADAKYEARKAQQQAERKKAWQEYFIEYGNYQQRRKSLIEKYDDELSELERDSPEFMAKTKEKESSLNALDEKFGVSVKAMADLFEDASGKSIAEIQRIIDKYETLVKFMSGSALPDGSTVARDEILSLGFTDIDLEKIESGDVSIKELTDALTSLKGVLSDASPWQSFKSGIEKGVAKIKLAKSDSASFGTGLMEIGNSIAEFAPQLLQFGQSINTIFGGGLAGEIEAVTGALGGLGVTASGVGQIMSGDIVGGTMSAVNGIAQMTGAIEGLFGADYSQYNRMVEEYNRLNDVWDRLIDKKREYIDISYGDEARQVGKETEELLNRKMDSNVVLGKERLNSGASAGSHSIGVRQRNGMSAQGWDELRSASRTIGFDYDSVAGARMTGLFDLSAEQLTRLQEEAPTFWAKLDDQVRGYLQNIIDCNDEIEDMKDRIAETFTGISFDGFYDNFVSMLMDMGSSTDDFIDNLNEDIKKSMLTNLIATKYRDELKKLYDSWVDMSDSNKDGVFDLDGDEVERLRNAEKDLADRIIAERNAMASAFGWDSSAYSQEATHGYTTQLSEDTGSEIVGRATALYESALRREGITELTNQTLQEMLERQRDNYTVASDARQILAESFLELVEIRQNTGAVVQPIKEINEKLDKIERNTRD